MTFAILLRFDILTLDVDHSEKFYAATIPLFFCAMSLNDVYDHGSQKRYFFMKYLPSIFVLVLISVLY